MTTEIQEYKPTEQAIADLRERFEGVHFDVTSKIGMDDARTARAEVRGYRTSLEKMRQELKAPLLQKSRALDAEAKRITLALKSIEDPIDRQIKTEENRIAAEREAKIEAERKRVEGIRKRIDDIRRLGSAAFHAVSTIDQLKDAQGDLETLALADSFDEFAAEAADAATAAKASLGAAIQAAEDREAEQAELKRLREENERLQREKAEQAAEAVKPEVPKGFEKSAPDPDLETVTKPDPTDNYPGAGRITKLVADAYDVPLHIARQWISMAAVELR